MTNALYDKGREKFLGPATGQINWKNDTIKVALVTSGYSPAPTTDEFLSDVGANTLGTDQTIGNKTTAAGLADGDDVTFTAVTSGSTVTYLVIYKFVTQASDSPLIALITNATGLPVLTNGGDITVQWDSGTNRIFKL